MTTPQQLDLHFASSKPIQMSNYAAREALERMNLREIAVAAHYGSIAADFRMMAQADPAAEQEAFMRRRAELCAAYGLNPTSQQNKPFAFASGFALIPVTGTMINRFGQCYGYMTGYNFIRSQMNAAEADDDVKGIIFDINTYGGEAAGCFELAAEIALLKKPTMGVIDSNCYSAGYALGSAMKKLVSTPSGGAGSIGVVAMHVDMSKLLADYGMAVTFIFAGSHKVDGNPYEPLPDTVKADIQKNIDATYGKFVALVAKNRKLDEKAVRETEARTYRAEDALRLGLIDAIATPNVAVQAFFDELSGSEPQLQQEPIMADDTKPGDTTAANQQALDKASSEARIAERARVSGIQNCEEAKDRPKLAAHIAMNTDMSVDAAKSMLSASAKETAPAPAAATPPANPFQAAMDASKNPQVGADGAQGGGAQATDAEIAQRMISNYSLATGHKVTA